MPDFEDSKNTVQKGRQSLVPWIAGALILSLLILYTYVIGVLKDVLETRSKAKQEEMIREHDLMYNGFSSWSERDHYRRLHKFHGTLYSEKDENGSAIFYDEKGRKCQLWDPLVRTDR